MRFIEFPRHQERKRNSLDNIVFSTRLRIARNLEGIKFPVVLSEKEKKEIDQQISKYIAKLPIELIIESIDEMPKENVFIYLSNHVITNEFLKNGRVLAYDINGNWVILINEDDHIRIMAVEEGYNVKNIYNRLSSIIIQLEDEIDFAFDEKYGYLTSSILNFGTGLRISALVNLYGLVSAKKIDNFIETANKTGYSVTNIVPHSSDSALFYIYNIFSLGISEEDLLSEFENFLHKLSELEMEARTAVFNKISELEISFEEIMELKKKETIEWHHLLYYISLIDALNKKHLITDNINQIRNQVFQATDDYLQYKFQVDENDLGKARLNILKKSISSIKYKVRSNP